MKTHNASTNIQLPEPPKEVSIKEARTLCKKEGVLISWRPNIHLPEEKQYCLVQGA